MATVIPEPGSKVEFLDIQANREKGIAGATGTVASRQDWVLHVEMDDPLNKSGFPSGRQYPTLKQVRVIEEVST